MGITKLMHMKENPRCSYIHLKNGINYILNPKKTENGLWVGGNTSDVPAEILEQMLNTKRLYGKMDGRQGYHFVISFAKGEVDAADAYEVVKDFCDHYLGDRYDYVFAIHNDKAHIHGHLIFNSVSRVDGYKYHYKSGDWEKFIQPVTDAVCMAHGISPLTFEKQRVGKSYAQWSTQNKNGLSNRDIIRADVDYAIQRSGNMEEFYHCMELMDYQIKQGFSKIHKAYISFKPPGHRSGRSYTLGKGYAPEELENRIRIKDTSKSYEDVMERLEKLVLGRFTSLGSVRSVPQIGRRIYQAVNYYQLPNPFAVPAGKVRKDMLQFEKLLDMCTYMQSYHLHTDKDLAVHQKLLEQQLESKLIERRTLYSLRDMEKRLDVSQREILRECLALRQEIENTKEDMQHESLDDALEQLMSQLPEGLIENKERMMKLTAVIRSMRQEIKWIRELVDASKDPLPELTKAPRI